MSAEQCADSIIYFSWACLSAPSCSYLSILSCLCCPICTDLSILSCLFCPVFAFLAFFSSHSLLAFLSWLSCLNYFLFYFLTILTLLSSYPCPVFPVLLVLHVCPVLLRPFLSLLSCLRYSVWTVIYKRLSWNCYSVLSTLSFFTFLSVLSCLFQILSCCAVLLSLFLSCSVFSRLSCLSSPFCSDPPVLSHHSCLGFLSLQPSLTCHYSVVLLAHLTQSYFQSLSCTLLSVLSLAVSPVSCSPPVSCCPSCLLSCLSPLIYSV